MQRPTRWTVLLALCLALPAFALPRPSKKVSFEFVNADVTSVLRLFAEVGHVNLVTSDTVSGKVTMSLRNVGWDEALRAVLAAKGLGIDEVGSIVRVATLQELAAEAALRAKTEEDRFKAAPLKTTLIRVNYANAADLAPQVRATLSSRGTVAVDARTNTLIIRDVE
ncbi:MAG: secretin N-terminal domain-containing protein [Myxococcaceae bacterium]